MTLVQNGLDEKRAIATMTIDHENNGRSKVDLATQTNLQVRNDPWAVQISTILFSDLIHEVVQKEDPSALVMKIDIEFFECRAFLGKKNLLKYKHLPV